MFFRILLPALGVLLLFGASIWIDTHQEEQAREERFNEQVVETTIACNARGMDAEVQGDVVRYVRCIPFKTKTKE